jgi:hypothetical protein
MKRITIAAAVLAVMGLSAPALRSEGKPEQTEGGKDARRMAMITAARIINVAEIDELMAKGKFEDWKTLSQSASIQKADVQMPQKVDVRVFADADGKRFSVVLKDTQDPCLYTISSDESGIIFQGQVVQGCPDN